MLFKRKAFLAYRKTEVIIHIIAMETAQIARHILDTAIALIFGVLYRTLVPTDMWYGWYTCFG